MKNKNKVFKKALEVLESKEFSCNALRQAISDINKVNRFDTGYHTKEYREMFGFPQFYNDGGFDPFVQAVGKHCSGSDEAFEFRVLLLSLAQVAWDDVYPKEVV